MGRAFKHRIEQALGNRNLGIALGRFSEAYAVARAKAYEGIDFEALRAEIASLKCDAAARLAELASQFAREAAAKGAKVVRAGTAEEACRYILRLARDHGVRRIIKSKSMATEEIGLNDDLRRAGLTVDETDLGEWILQLAKERPSHMIMPAIHLTKEDVAGFFSQQTSERLPADIPRLVKVARRELRGKFLQADLGITGANIAVAETGSLVIVSNEGNARLATTLPRIHVALVGIEKLIGRWRDVAPILTALPRSATAQLMTSYVSVITGAVPNIDGTSKELHVILLDNGRSAMAADPVFKEALQCIRCASCLNVCPVFRLVGGHVFGDVYTGGIGTILTAWLAGLKKSADIQALCIQCGRCREVCPAKIDIPELIAELRGRLAREQGEPLVQKAVLSIARNRRVFHTLLRAASLAAQPLAKDGLIRHLPLFLSDLCKDRSLPAIAPVPFRDRFEAIGQPRCREKAVLFAGCLVDFVYPALGEAMVAILNRAEIEVLFPEGQGCCGAPARLSGDFDSAREHAIDNLGALLTDAADYVVCACPACTLALRKEFRRTLERHGNSSWPAKANVLADKSWDFMSLAQTLLVGDRLRLRDSARRQRVTYHDSCHLIAAQRRERAPRDVLGRCGYDLVEMQEPRACCGMGGTYSLEFPKISARLLRRKLDLIEESRAPLVAMDCPGCLMQLRGGLDKAGSPVQAKHSIELLLERLA